MDTRIATTRRTLRRGAFLVATAVCLVVAAGCSGSATPAATASSGASNGATTTATTRTGGTATSASGVPAAPPDAGQGGGSSSTELSGTATGVYSQAGGTATKSGETLTATNADESGVLVSGGGSLTLDNVTVTTSGDRSSSDNSSFAGLNAGVLATGGSTITMAGGSISTTGTGANGGFASGSGSSLALTNVTITATADGGHGVMATQGGSVTVDGGSMTTSGAHGAPLATDRGGGTIVAGGGSYVANGLDSPGIYSTGSISVSDATFTESLSENIVIEGANSVTLTGTTMTSGSAKSGVMIYQSMSGDASGSEGTVTATGGSLVTTNSSAPAFYVTNATGVINLQAVTVTDASGVLVKAAAGSWGTSGANGGTVTLMADGETLSGNVVADGISTVALTLSNGSSLTGAIDADDSAKSIDLSLDGTSTWMVTADSHLTTITGATVSGTSIANITGAGHTVTYDKGASANAYLDGGTYTLGGGGTLTPAS